MTDAVPADAVPTDGMTADRVTTDAVAAVAVPADAVPADAVTTDGVTTDAVTAVARFGAAFDRHDVDAMMAAMTEDCVFESTAPPDGARYEGAAAVRGAWREFFATSPGAAFETEEQFASSDRVVIRWRYSFPGGYVRGVDLFRVRGGLVAEKLSYVKG